jgi:hypothetical protein
MHTTICLRLLKGLNPSEADLNPKNVLRLEPLLSNICIPNFFSMVVMCRPSNFPLHVSSEDSEFLLKNWRDQRPQIVLSI